MAGTYVVVAGSLMQAGAVILPAFELPASAMRLMILSLAVGFPLAILLAWLLDISPRGIRLARRRLHRADTGAVSADGGTDPREDADAEHDAEEEGVGPAADASIFARSLEMILLGLALPVLGFALVVLGASWRSGGQEIVRAATATSDDSAVASLAVLPFADLSSEGTDGGFFARGMHEDILAQLARLPRLKLISRTSVMAYVETTKSVREIGEELAVEHVLEGSVRRSATHVRVTAQLIRTATDEHVWAEQFDAELADVFTVQSRIAAAIARSLERELAPEHDASAAPAELAVVPAAYDAYQKARDLHRDLDPADRARFDQTQHLYEEARRLDPRFAPAWIQLAILHAEARWFGLDRSPARIEQARRCLDEGRTRASAPDQIALAEGIFAYYVDQDYGKALLFFDDATRLAPGSAEPFFYRAMILRRQGELDRSLEAEARALELDPLNLAHRDEHALTLALAGRLDTARDELDAILERDPERPRAQVQRWQVELELEGRPDRLLETLLAVDRSRWLEPHYSMLETVAILAGQPQRALQVLDRPTPFPLARTRLAYQRSVLARHAGDDASATRALDEALAAFAEWRQRVRASGAESASPLEVLEVSQLEALLAAEGGRFERALELQVANVEAFPIERDLIGGGPALWLLADLQIRAGELAQAGRSLERLAGRMALGSVPFGGYFVLSRGPDHAAARRDPSHAALLARLRPRYADAWPPVEEPTPE